jgi:hypothetical protein
MSSSSRVGFSVRLLLTVSLLGLVCPWLAHGQVTFLVPPTYTGAPDFVADFNDDGKPDLLSRDGTLQLGKGDGTFKMGAPVVGGALAIGDFNGDGKMDVLQQGTGALLVLLGNGDGTFQSPISTNSAATLTAVVAGDVNGDGKADVLGIFNNSVVVYLGQGDGKFAAGVSYAVGNAALGDYLITLGDFNGDYFSDIAVSLSGDHVAGQEVVLLGNGDGTFQSGKISTGVQSPRLAVAGDFNGDGKLDLVVSGAIAYNAYPLSLLLGNGDGTFQPATTITTNPASNGGLAAADLNGDGKLDLVLVPGITEIYLGNGDGSFSNTHNYWGQPFTSGDGVATSGVAIADFNLDGKLDVAAGEYVLVGDGDGTFQGLLTQPIVGVGAVTGRFDKHGKGATDIAEISANSSNSLYILSNDGTGTLTLSHTYTLQQPSYGIATGDLNGDGNPDLVVVGTDPITQDWSYSVLLGNGDGSFQPPEFYPQSVLTGAAKYSIVIADFNNDHKLDLAISMGGAGGDQTMAVLLGKGDGTFASPAYFFDGASSDGTFLVAADFNGDGNVDIAASATGNSGRRTALLFGKGDGTFQAATFPLGDFMAEFTADFNNDGKADLVGVGAKNDQVVLLGNGDGTFMAQPVFTGYAIDAVADINGDGIPDLVASLDLGNGHGFNTYGVYLGNGDGTFGPFITAVFVDGSLPTFGLAADMNGDGKVDLISNAGGGYTFVLLNTTMSVPANFVIAPVAGSRTSTTISAGDKASFNLAITPSGSFHGAVNLACSVSPVVMLAPTCVVPATVQVGAVNPAVVTVTVNTTGSASAGTVTRQSVPPGATPIAWAVFWFVSGLLLVRNRRRWPAFAGSALMLSFVFLSGCGGGSPTPPSGTPANTYAFTVTATSGSLTSKTTVRVIVQ